MKYLIVGNSAAAVSAVDAIRSLDAQGEIVMVSPEADLAYGTPLISYVLEGRTDVEHMGIRDARWYEENDITCLFGQGKGAVALDASAKTVTLEDGTELAYDKLLVACGSVPSDAGVPGVAEAPNSFTFNTVGDMRAVEACLAAIHERKDPEGLPVNVVISGSGLIGSKAAEGICEHADTTYLVGHAARPLRKLLDDEASAMLVDLFAEHGIVNVPGTVVTAVKTDDEGAITSVELSDGRELACDMLVTAIGVRPNVAMLEAAGAKVSRGAVCDEHMQTSLADVYAAGDVANTHNVLLGGEAPLALWPTASEQGRVAGRAMAGDEQTVFEGSFARNAVGFFGAMNILGCGVINPTSDTPDIESVVSVGEGTYSKFNMRDGKLVGYLLMNRPEGAGIYTKIISEQIALDALPDDIFDRTPEMLDLPTQVRVDALMQGYPDNEKRSA